MSRRDDIMLDLCLLKLYNVVDDTEAMEVDAAPAVADAEAVGTFIVGFPEA